MKSYNHPNVLPLYVSFVHKQDLWMVMPFISGGSVLHIMKYGHPEGLDEAVIATIMREVLKALDYVHKHAGIHRDVKARGAPLALALCFWLSLFGERLGGLRAGPLLPSLLATGDGRRADGRGWRGRRCLLACACCPSSRPHATPPSSPPNRAGRQHPGGQGGQRAAGRLRRLRLHGAHGVVGQREGDARDVRRHPLLARARSPDARPPAASCPSFSFYILCAPCCSSAVPPRQRAGAPWLTKIHQTKTNRRQSPPTHTQI